MQKPVTISSKFKDTVLCNGNAISWKTKAKSITGKWQWKDITRNSILSTNDSLRLKATQTTQIQLTLKNGCMGDTNTFTLYVNPPLKAAILTAKGNLRDTILCFDQSLKLFSTGKGGTGAGYKFNWYLKNIPISNSDTFELKTDTYFLSNGESKLLNLVLKDNCTNGADSISKTITVIPSPKADFTFGTACDLSNTKFTFIGTKPASPISTTLYWDFNKQGSSTINNPANLFSTTGKKIVTLTLASNNGCKDEMVKEVIVKPQSKADFIAADVCENDSIVFINKSTVSTGTITYNWSFGDGQKSTSESLKHLYNIGGISKTYNVRMTAIVPNGCSDSITKAVNINAKPVSNFNYTLNGSNLDLKATQSNNSTYRWLFGVNDSITTTTINYSHTITKPEQYNICLKITNYAGCVSETCKKISIGISPLIKENEIRLFPNPNAGSFSIEIINPSKDISITVYNLLGQKIKTIETFTSKTYYFIELNGVAGVYLVKVINGEMTFTEKVFVFN